MSVGTKREIVLLSGLMASVLGDTIFTSVGMEFFREMNLAQESVGSDLEDLESLVFVIKWYVVDDGLSTDGSIWLIILVGCFPKFIAFGILTLSHLLDEERVFR